jgi:hypothetical protein
MTVGKKKPVTIQPTPGPTDEPGQQPTPDGDALAEIESVQVGAATLLSKVAAALSSSGAFNQGGAMFRDVVDIDVGMHELMKVGVGMTAASLSALGTVCNTVLASKQIDLQAVTHARNTNAEVLANFENNAHSFMGMITKSNTTAQSALTQAYSLESDNEVITTMALAKALEAVTTKVDAMWNALQSEAPKE